MKVCICGSRHCLEVPVSSAVEGSGFDVTELVSGHSGRVDLAAERWASEHGIPIRKFPYPSRP